MSHLLYQSTHLGLPIFTVLIGPIVTVICLKFQALRCKQIVNNIFHCSYNLFIPCLVLSSILANTFRLANSYRFDRPNFYRNLPKILGSLIYTDNLHYSSLQLKFGHIMLCLIFYTSQHIQACQFLPFLQAQFLPQFA